jgi:hypothetical protein
MKTLRRLASHVEWPDDDSALPPVVRALAA